MVENLGTSSQIQVELERLKKELDFLYRKVQWVFGLTILLFLGVAGGLVWPPEKPMLILVADYTFLVAIIAVLYLYRLCSRIRSLKPRQDYLTDKIRSLNQAKSEHSGKESKEQFLNGFRPTFPDES